MNGLLGVQQDAKAVVGRVLSVRDPDLAVAVLIAVGQLHGLGARAGQVCLGKRLAANLPLGAVCHRLDAGEDALAIAYVLDVVQRIALADLEKADRPYCCYEPRGRGNRKEKQPLSWENI